MKKRLFRPPLVRWSISGLAVVLIGIAAIPTKSEPVVHVRLVVSTDIASLLAGPIADFNAAGQTVGVRAIRVEMVVKPSGQAEIDIAEGVDHSTAWVPASHAWVSLLATDTRARWGEVTRSLVRSPIVFTMWKQLAECWGWPRRAFGWLDVRRLARSKQGLCGNSLRLGQTRPDESTSGLVSTVQQFAAVAGVPPQALTVKQVDDHKVQAGVRAIQSAMVHYCAIAQDFVQQLGKNGPAYVSAISMQETTLPSNLMTEVFPQEGTMFADYPFVVLGAPWVSPVQATAAKLLSRWLGKHITPEAAAVSRFRLKGRLPPGASTVGETDEVYPPSGSVLARVRSAWERLRKRAHIVVLVDTSHHMSTEGRWLRARDFLEGFVHKLTLVDHAGLITFSDRVQNRVPMEALSSNAPALQRALQELVPGNTESRLLDAIHAALQQQAMRDRNTINVILLVSAGDNEGSRHTLRSIQQELARSHVQLVPISYGPTEDLLQKLADSGRGQVYEGTGDPRALSDQIASCF